MNYRDYKIFAPNNYYHIFNRGVDKMDIFRDDSDYRFFLYRFKENLFPEMMAPFRGLPPEGRHQGKTHTPYIRKSLPVNAYSLLCYCLMPNHFHFLIRQNIELSVSKIIAKVCTSYSKYFNQKYERVGSLLQDRFKAVLVESDAQLLWLSAYVHNNPKTGDLVDNLKDFPFSSYLDYIGLRNGKLIDKSLILGMVKNEPILYKKFVEESYIKINERKDLKYLLLD